MEPEDVIVSVEISSEMARANAEIAEALRAVLLPIANITSGILRGLQDMQEQVRKQIDRFDSESLATMHDLVVIMNKRSTKEARESSARSLAYRKSFRLRPGRVGCSRECCEEPSGRRGG